MPLASASMPHLVYLQPHIATIAEWWPAMVEAGHHPEVASLCIMWIPRCCSSVRYILSIRTRPCRRLRWPHNVPAMCYLSCFL
jgi:hypothetical protein